MNIKVPATQTPLSSDDSDLSEERSRRPTLSRRPAVLIVTASVTETIELVKDRVVIGRAPDCDISFVNSRSLCRHHAQFVRIDEGYGFEDFGSAIGSYVNGSRVNNRVTLKDGDRIDAGQAILIYSSGR